ncbi:hypothetical protein [Plantactinospora sp. KBS50]|uniref:hypothetical protein n=1 Tax=Plantactinospora sp. KBS50 TaxID=2024580 RepID=UPI000BAABDF1|nr:hypothetical protein [Plantactinospora sp. KBS50]ASW55523.1 hypothetical protein CIK06_17090 [Plantactinospora sp. KBS50]
MRIRSHTTGRRRLAAIVGTAVLTLVAALLTAAPATANGAPYVGKQYDYGGTVTDINGGLSTVDSIAASITASTAATESAIAAQRATLPYGDITPGAGPALSLYPGPSGVAASNRYAVTVNGQSSFTYQALARKTDTNREEDTSWTSFSFSGSVTVQVTALNQSGLTGCMVRPYAAAIATSYANNVCTFTMSQPRNVSVEFNPNIHNPIAHPMLVFANPPENDVPPATGDPNVRYFGPGVHYLGAGQVLQDNQTIYLAGGAYLQAAFIAPGAVHNLTIKGRGIIDGLFLDTGDQDLNKNQPGIIDIADQSSTNVLIEGITIVNAPRFNVRALAQYTTIENVKTMSWWYSTDGMVGGNKSLLENNFVKSNDDSIKLFWGDTIARKNTIWQLENGASFMISWNLEVDSQNFHVYDNDVIHVEHYFLAKPAVFRALHAGSGTPHRYLFENIRVENANWRLFYLAVENNKWYDPSKGYGELDQLIFRNIHSYSQYSQPNVVRGIDGTHKARNINFVNVYDGANCIWNAGTFDIDPASTNAIRIAKSQDGSCWT